MTGVKFIEPAELGMLMPLVEKNECILLDVRSVSEFRSSHIPYARSIPLEELQGRSGELDDSKGLVIYCRTGKRSLRALSLLEKEFPKGIMVLEGGIESWPGDLVRD